MKLKSVLPYSIMISLVRIFFRYLLSLVIAGGMVFLLSLVLRAPSIISDPSVKPVIAFCLEDLLLFSIPLIIFVGILVLFNTLTFEKMRLVSRILLAVLVAASIFGVSQLWPSFQNFPVMPHKQDIKAQTIYKTNNFYFWAQSAGETSMSGVMSIKDAPHEKSADGKPLPNYELSKGLSFDSKDGSFTDTESKKSFKYKDIQGASSSLLTTSESGLIDTFGASLRYGLSALMKIVSSSLLQSALWSVSIGLFCLSLWYWVRITRWPYWNGLWTFIWSIAAFVGVISLLVPENHQIVMDMGHPISDYFLPGALAAISLILIILTLFLKPFKDWKKEVMQ